MAHNNQAAAAGTKKIKVVVGLGNPDPLLLKTYHNAGMLALPVLAKGFTDGPLVFKRYKDIFEYARAGALVFVRPLVFMNESGHAVKEALRVLDAVPGELAVAHDDSDITLGRFKIAEGGGAAGHNGIRSIIAHLNTEEFTRIRIGIRDEHEEHRKKAGDFVLSPITASNMEKMEAAFGDIAEELRKTMGGGA